MVQFIDPITVDAELFYPESDGKPVADNTIQFRLIMMIQGGIDTLFADDPNVFVAGDLLWYPTEGSLTCQAPDTMVVFGRPKGDRRSYKQWQEDHIAPQVVFEILSHTNTKAEMERKLEFYQQHGVEEYYEYDPDKNQLQGWLRQRNRLTVITPMDGWISPRLGIRFETGRGSLEVYRPDGQCFETLVEISQRADQEAQRAAQEERRANQEAQRADQEAQRADQEAQRADQEAQRAEQEAQARYDAILQLSAEGFTVERIASVLGFSVSQVRQRLEKNKQ